MKEETEKITIRAFRGDKEKLASFFPGIGYNKAMRHIIHSCGKGLEEKARQRQPIQQPSASADISIEEIQQAAGKDEAP